MSQRRGENHVHRTSHSVRENQNDRATLKETKKDIEALKKRLSNLEGLYYRCWSKRILSESSVVNMTSEKVKRIINYEKAQNKKKYGLYYM